MTTETTQLELATPTGGSPARYRTKAVIETVDAIQVTEDNQDALMRFCDLPVARGLRATVTGLPGPGGIMFPCNLRPGDWIVKHASLTSEHFSVHGPTAFGMAYGPVPGTVDGPCCPGCACGGSDD